MGSSGLASWQARLGGGALLLAALLVLSACAPRQVSNGHLVVIGGSLQPHNTEVYERLVMLSDEGTVGVLPTASGSPEESGRAEAARLNLHLGEDRAAVIDVPGGDPEAADSDVVAEAIGQHSGVYFTGGDQARVTAAFLPEGRETRGLRALRELLERDGFIAGTSAGAAILSDPMIVDGTSRDALAHGIRREADTAEGVRIAPGIGFLDQGLTDQHIFTRGRLGRLIVAQQETRTPFGFGVDDNRAFHLDLNTGVLEALGGPHGVVFVDLSRSTHSRGGHYGIRLSVLSSGDRLIAESGEVIPAVDKVRLRQPHGDPEELVAEDAWARNAIRDLIVELAFQPVRTALALDESFELRFIEDDWTRFWTSREGEPDSLTVVNLRLDIVPRLDGDVADADGCSSPLSGSEDGAPYRETGRSAG